MAGLMIYIPGGGGRPDFPRLGLESLLDKNVQVLSHEIAKGPDSGRGSLVAFDSPEFPRDTPTSYDEKTQVWRPAAVDGELAYGRYWIGCVRDAKPKPAELQRRAIHDGEPVELDDHGVWVIPIAEYLPQRITHEPLSGKEISVPKDEHREFVELANATFEHFLSDGFAVALKQCRVTIPKGRRLADLALSKNYRVNADVIDLLELLDDQALLSIAKVATGLSLAGRVIDQKKSAEASPSL